tara:strand:+ start:30265 stop:30591 length:327 start_codon:yes stop_codon:yes gene_type:complete
MENVILSQIPIGEALLKQDDSILKIVLERIDLDTVNTICYAPHTERLVLHARITISTGSTYIKYLDSTFWIIKLNGEIIENPTVKTFEKLSANVTAQEDLYLVELSGV